MNTANLVELVELLEVANRCEPMPSDSTQEAIARIRENVAAALQLASAMLESEREIDEMMDEMDDETLVSIFEE